MTYEFGYCPYNLRPYCCAAVVSTSTCCSISSDSSVDADEVWVGRSRLVSTAGVVFLLMSMSLSIECNDGMRLERG